MADSAKSTAGQAVLLGAGPAGAALITLEGKSWLSRADTVVYDRLASPEILAFAPPSAELIDVGKQPDRHPLPQEQINQLLIDHVRGGKLVVRLKGGDPLIFGRGSEEADALRQADCAFRVVPGITAASAAAAYAGIALTDRRCASSVALVTGHEDPAKTQSTIDYAALAGIDTVVFYMGVGRMEEITSALQSAGKPGETPAAVVARAGSASQQTVVADLATIAGACRKADIEPPALLIVSHTVSLRERVNWFDRLPLFGRRVLVTASQHTSEPLAEGLAALGAEVLAAPAIEIQPADDAAFASAFDGLWDNAFAWIVFTSPSGVKAFFDDLLRNNHDARLLSGAAVAAVGEATSEALRQRSIAPELTAEPYTTAALGEALCEAGIEGSRILRIRSDIAPPDLAETLKAAGADVVELTAYRTACPRAWPPHVSESLAAGSIDWIAFTSASTVTNSLKLCDRQTLSRAKLAAIGPVTAEALRAAGLEPGVVARPHTAEGLVEAIRAAEQG